MFQLSDGQPSPRVCALCAAVLAMLLCSCAQRTAIAPQNGASVAGSAPGVDLPEVVISAPREKSLRLSVKADSKAAPKAK